MLYPIVDKVFRYSIRHYQKDKLNIFEIVIPKLADATRAFWFKLTYYDEIVDRLFRRIIKLIDPDIVHFQHLYRLSASLIDVVKMLKIPSVITLHDYWFICPRFHLLTSDNKPCNGPSFAADNCFKCWNAAQARNICNYLGFSNIGFCKLVEQGLKYINSATEFDSRKKYFYKLLSKVDKIIAPSKFLRSIYLKTNYCWNKIVYLPNGYDVTLFKDFVRKERKDKIVFGFAGGIQSHKGIKILINAFNMLRDENRNAELRIYGSTSKSYLRFIKESIRNPYVKLVGKFVDPKRLFSEIDVLIFPSICYENCPLILQEAIITETPVIASSIGAIPEYVEDNVTGFLFDAGNPVSLYEKIKLIIDSPDVIDVLRKNIKKLKKEMIMPIEAHVGELEKIYKSVI